MPYVPKSALAKGFIDAGNVCTLFESPKETNLVIEKIFIQNTSTTQTIALTFHRIIDGEVCPMGAIEMDLPPKYSLDVIDPGDVIRMKAGDYFRGKASLGNALKFTIDGYEAV